MLADVVTVVLGPTVSAVRVPRAEQTYLETFRFDHVLIFDCT